MTLSTRLWLPRWRPYDDTLRPDVGCELMTVRIQETPASMEDGTPDETPASNGSFTIYSIVGGDRCHFGYESDTLMLDTLTFTSIGVKWSKITTATPQKTRLLRQIYWNDRQMASPCATRQAIHRYRTLGNSALSNRSPLRSVAFLLDCLLSGTIMQLTLVS